MPKGKHTAFDLASLAAILVFLALGFLSACGGTDSADEPAVPVVGTWTGRYEAKEYGILVNILLEIGADRQYLATARPKIEGLDSTVVYEEKGTWSIVDGNFIAAKSACRQADPEKVVLKPTPCPPDDTAAVAIIGDSLWTGKMRGESVVLIRKK